MNRYHLNLHCEIDLLSRFQILRRFLQSIKKIIEKLFKKSSDKHLIKIQQLLSQAFLLLLEWEKYLNLFLKIFGKYLNNKNINAMQFLDGQKVLHLDDLINIELLDKTEIMRKKKQIEKQEKEKESIHQSFYFENEMKEKMEEINCLINFF